MTNSTLFSSAQITAMPKVSSRAHCLVVLRDPISGQILNLATVNVYQPGTTTPIAGTLYDQSGNVLSNPLTSDASTGLVNFFMQVSQDVDLSVSKTGFITTTYPNVPVITSTALSTENSLPSTGSMIYAAAPNTPGTITPGSPGSFLRNVGGIPQWTVLDSLSLNGSLSVASGISGVLQTVAQPNITSVGTLSSLTSSGTITGAGIRSTSWLAAGVNLSTTPGDLTANRNGTGYVWLGDNTHSIGFDGTNYQLANSDLYIAGNLVVTSANNGSFVTGPYTYDWFRNNNAGHGFINQETSRGGYFGVNGLVDYPYNYTYYHSGMFSVPASGIVGVNDSQILTNKILDESLTSHTNFFGAGVGEPDLGNASLFDGQFRIWKAWGGSLTVIATGSGTNNVGIALGPNYSLVSTLAIPDGTSVVFYASIGYWWVVAKFLA